MNIASWIRVLLFVCMLWAPTTYAADAAPDFTLRDINGTSVSLSEYKGKVIVMSFWATWCGPCKEEMPHLQQMLNERGDKGVVVFSVSTDDARTASQVKPYIKRMGYSFTVLLDRSSSVLTQYNPSKTLPFTVIIDQEQNIAKVHSGYNPGDEKELFHFVKGLLGEKDVGPAPAH
jgi:peroxiredoxin